MEKINDEEFENGSIDITTGCMFSGKTENILNKASGYEAIGMTVLNINYVHDNRYGENNIASHNLKKKSSINVQYLSEIKQKHKEKFDASKVICIDEAQFFSDLKKCVLDYCYNDKKKIIISGLDGDFKQEPFGEILNLIPHADSITKLHAFCGICKNGTHAHFTKRIINNSVQVLIGSEESYIPVCRKHLQNDDNNNNNNE